MILPDFVLCTRANQHWKYSGIDSPELCLDQQHFQSYPWPVEYQYNSRGFRDQEWPNTKSDLQQAIWCVGDSFTVGIGSPRQHTWTCILEQVTGSRTINISMDGASNNWIARKSIAILEQIRPDVLILHWSYIARRELELLDHSVEMDAWWNGVYESVRDSSWPECAWYQANQLPDRIKHELTTQHGLRLLDTVGDEFRILQSVRCDPALDVANTLHCVNSVNQHAGHTKIIHTFIPNFVSKNLKGQIESQINGLVVAELSQLDVARDGHHYDIQTSQSLVEQILPLLNR